MRFNASAAEDTPEHGGHLRIVRYVDAGMVIVAIVVGVVRVGGGLESANSIAAQRGLRKRRTTTATTISGALGTAFVVMVIRANLVVRSQGEGGASHPMARIAWPLLKGNKPR